MPNAPRIHGQSASRNGKATKVAAFTKPDTRPTAGQRGYDGRWQAFVRVYRSENPLCEMCKAGGFTKPVDMVDHIVPLSEGGAHCSKENSMSLCWKHHRRKTARDTKRRGAE